MPRCVPSTTSRVSRDWLHAKTPQVRESIKDKVVETALEHQLVTKFTSRVAVEEKVVEETLPDGSLTTVKVQVPLPKGWDPAQFHATATDDTLLLLSAVSMLLTGLFTRCIRRKAAEHA